MAPDALNTLIRQELVSQRSALLSRCFEHLDKSSKLEDVPGFESWKGFLEASRDQLVVEIQGAPEALFDTVNNGPIATDLDGLQQHGKAFAEALTAWPEICEVALTLS